MTFEIGHLTLGAIPSRAARERLPMIPPPEALDAVTAAWDRGERLAADDQELHFERDGQGRMRIELRTRAGLRLAVLTPSQALELMSDGGAVPPTRPEG
jgi:hypothetical protein